MKNILIYSFLFLSAGNVFADVCHKEENGLITCADKNNTLRGQDLKMACETEIKDFIRAYNADESCGEIHMAAISVNPLRLNLQDTIMRFVRIGLSKEARFQQEADRIEQQMLVDEKRVEDDFKALTIED